MAALNNVAGLSRRCFDADHRLIRPPGYGTHNQPAAILASPNPKGEFVSRLTDLIAQAESKDPQLGADLDQEFKLLSSRLPFGLNFERHRPEAVELPQRSIRKGDKVRVLPPRGSTKKGDPRLWQVKAIRKVSAGRVAELELLNTQTPEIQFTALDDLVVGAEFRDTIYPGLVSTGRVHRGGDKPHYTVINGENFGEHSPITLEM